MRYVYVILFFFVLSNSFSQENFTVLKSNFPDSLPEKYRVDVIKEYEEYFKAHPNIDSNELTSKHVLSTKNYNKAFFESSLCAKK